MITDKLIQECIAFDKSEYNIDKTPEQMREELEKLQAKGCLVEHSFHCPGCPKFRNGCPL